MYPHHSHLQGEQLNIYNALRYAGAGGSVICMMTHCFTIMTACFADSTCMTLIKCMNGCGSGPDVDPNCYLECELRNPHSMKFTAVTKCINEKKCVDPEPDDGKCLVNLDTDGLKNITSID